MAVILLSRPHSKEIKGAPAWPASPQVEEGASDGTAHHFEAIVVRVLVHPLALGAVVDDERAVGAFQQPNRLDRSGSVGAAGQRPLGDVAADKPP